MAGGRVGPASSRSGLHSSEPHHTPRLHTSRVGRSFWPNAYDLIAVVTSREPSPSLSLPNRKFEKKTESNIGGRDPPKKTVEDDAVSLSEFTAKGLAGRSTGSRRRRGSDLKNPASPVRRTIIPYHDSSFVLAAVDFLMPIHSNPVR